MSKHQRHQLLDPYDLARRHQALTGQMPLGELARLLPSLADVAGVVHWQASFAPAADAAGEPAAELTLTVRARLSVPCVRCVEATEQAIDRAQHYRLVADEAIASQMDQELVDIDVLACGHQFDLSALIEDELIMALPLMPRHEKCPDDAALASPTPDQANGPQEAERQFPFADLASQLADEGDREGGKPPKRPGKRRQ